MLYGDGLADEGREEAAPDLPSRDGRMTSCFTDVRCLTERVGMKGYECEMRISCSSLCMCFQDQ